MSQITTSNKSGNGLEIMGMKLNNLTEAIKVADYFAQSDLVPKDYKGKPGNIVVAWQKGHEVGLMPQQALETIGVINGRACIWGDGLIALIKNSPKEEWTNEWIEGSGESLVAYCETKRFGQPKTIKRSFSKKEATTAGLWGNNVWKKYPNRMLQNRARGFCLRDAYPDVLNGLQMAEEQQDAESVNYVKNIEELEVSVIQLGLSLVKENNVATVHGNTFQHSKSLREMGFEHLDGNWIVHYEDFVDAEIVRQDKTEPVQNKQISSPAKDLMSFLKDNGLTKEEIGSFVKDTLKLDSSDNDGINAVLANKDTLNVKIKKFLADSNDEAEKHFKK